MCELLGSMVSALVSTWGSVVVAMSTVFGLCD